MRRIAVTLTVMGVLPLSLPAGAVAQVYDDGPADKEYAIPLKEARDKGQSQKGGSGGETSSNRFGEGISTETPTEDSAAPSDTSGEKKKQKTNSADDGGGEKNEVAVAPSSAGGSGDGGGGSGADNSAALLTGGIALAVLLIGGAVALMARRTATDDV